MTLGDIRWSINNKHIISAMNQIGNGQAFCIRITIQQLAVSIISSDIYNVEIAGTAIHRHIAIIRHPNLHIHRLAMIRSIEGITANLLSRMSG